MKSKVRINKFRVAVAVFILLFCILYFLIYVAPKVSDAFVETYVCEFGTVDVDFTSDYLCVRNEKVHTSDGTGDIERKAKAGNLVRVGNRVVTIGGVDYRAQERGIVSYTYDGLEEKYNPDGIEDLKISCLTPSRDEKGNSTYKLSKCASETAKPGSKVFRIIDSHKWYLVFWVDQETADRLAELSRVTIEMPDEEKTQLRFRVEAVETSDPEESDEESRDDADKEEAETEAEEPEETSGDEPVLRRAVFSCDRYYDKVDTLRYGKARVITSRATGIVLETSSITEADGVKGVYVKNKYNDYVFTPIKIIAEVGDKTVVESRTFYDPESDKIISTVKNYDSIKKGDGSGDVDQD